MEDPNAPLIPAPGGSLVDDLMAQQDEVMRQLDELDQEILRTIRVISEDREEADRSAA
jgi:hypothetical protein